MSLEKVHQLTQYNQRRSSRIRLSVAGVLATITGLVALPTAPAGAVLALGVGTLSLGFALIAPLGRKKA